MKRIKLKNTPLWLSKNALSKTNPYQKMLLIIGGFLIDIAFRSMGLGKWILRPEKEITKGKGI